MISALYLDNDDSVVCGYCEDKELFLVISADNIVTESVKLAEDINGYIVALYWGWVTPFLIT